MAQIRNSPIPASATASTSLLEHPFALVWANAFDGVAWIMFKDSGNPFLPSSPALLNLCLQLPWLEQVSLGLSCISRWIYDPP